MFLLIRCARLLDSFFVFYPTARQISLQSLDLPVVRFLAYLRWVVDGAVSESFLKAVDDKFACGECGSYLTEARNGKSISSRSREAAQRQRGNS